MINQLRGDLDALTATVNAGGALYTKKTVTVAFGDFTADTADLAQSFNIGTVLPAGAIPVGAQVNLATAFVGLAAPKLDVGIASGTELANQFNTAGATGKYFKPPTAAKYSGAQLTAVFTPASGKKLKTDSSAGSVTIDVFYFVAF